MADDILATTPVRPCVKCGSIERYDNGNCKPCARALNKAWHAKNREKSIAKSIAWYHANPEKSAKNNAVWAKANPEKRKAYSQTDSAKASARRWQKENPEKFKASVDAWKARNHLKLRIYQNNNRAKAMGRIGNLSSNLVGRLLNLQQGMCPCCQQPLSDSFQMDHIVALHNGGENEDHNIQLLRAGCNSSKRTKDPIEFMRSRGFLI